MRLPARILFFILFFSFSILHAQQDKQRLRSCVAKLKTEIPDSERVFCLDAIGWDTSYDNLAVGLKYAQEGLALAEQIHYDIGIIHACNTIGTIYLDMGDINKSLDAHMKGLKLAEKTNNKKAMATSSMNMALVYSSLGDRSKELECLLRSRALYIEMNDTNGIASASSNLGGAYSNFPDSIEKAVACYNVAMKISAARHDMSSVANCYGGLAKCYQLLGDTLAADRSMQRGIAIIDSLHNDYDLSDLLVNYAKLLVDRGHYTRAEALLMRTLAICRKIGMREQEKDVWEGLSEVYQKSGQMDKALHALKRFSELKDSLTNENVLRHKHDLEAMYENEKKESQIALLTKEQTLQNTYLTVLITGCVLLLLFLFVLFNRNKIRKRSNEQLAQQNAVIEEKNKNITDSINYARRIQEAVLPAQELLTNYFTDAFVLYRPRDIVSGDFWWCTEKNGKIFIAAADCTGHGVPGGFMSVMGAAFLSEIVNEKNVARPDEILNLLRLKVIAALKQKSEENTSAAENSFDTVKDGMDIVMCVFSPKERTLELSCANNAVWIIRNAALKEIDPDKFPVGIFHNQLQPFTLHREELQAGDMIYLFTDGYADQFGGPAGKKFKYRQMQEMFLEIFSKSCREQEAIAGKRFDDWKGGNEQVDDVLILGVRI